MKAESLILNQYRNIETAEIRFAPGINILVGDNAQGKTNALEAIYLFAEGKSFRAKSEKELIRFGNEDAKAVLTFSTSQRQEKLEFLFHGEERRDAVRRSMKHNDIPLKKIGDMIGIFRAILFCPEHLMLVKGGPGERRAFLDIALSQLYPIYLKTLQKFYALLAERNKLLKDAREDRTVFDATNELWAIQMAECDAVLTEYRQQYIVELDTLAKEYFRAMTSDKEIPTFIYKPSCGNETDLSDRNAIRDQYISLYTSQNGEREIQAGSTLWGIHRDDLSISINEKEARLYASQGQDRSIALAMKLAEGLISEQKSGDPPVFLFDDVMSELDQERRAFLIQNFSGKQIIMTSCDPQFFDKSDRYTRINVENGRFIEEQESEADA